MTGKLLLDKNVFLLTGLYDILSNFRGKEEFIRDNVQNSGLIGLYRFGSGHHIPVNIKLTYPLLMNMKIL